MGLSCLTLGLLALLPQSSYGRYRIDPPGEILDTLVADADHDGHVEFWLATLEDEQRRLVWFAPDPERGYSATATDQLTISRAVVAWAAGNFTADPGPEIILTTREAAYLQRLGGRPQKIHDAPMLLDLPSSTALPVLREVCDVDGDGLDELLLPTREGYHLIDGTGQLRAEIPWTPREGRTPVAQQALFGGRARATLSSSALADLFVPEESPGIVTRPPLLFTSASLPRPMLTDLNGDGRVDLSFVDRDQLRIHLQGAGGAFRSTPHLWRNLPSSRAQDEAVLTWGNYGGSAAADLLMVRSNSGIGVSFDWTIRVWFDVCESEELGEPGYFRKVEGSWVMPTIRDLDGDGRPELGVSVWELSLGLTLREPTVEHALYVFRPREDGPGWETRAALASQRSYGVHELESFAVVPSFPGDLSGNGLADTLQSSGAGELERRPLELGQSARVGEVEARVPVDALAAVVRVRDLNADGVGDLLVAKLGHWEVYLSR